MDVCSLKCDVFDVVVLNIQYRGEKDFFFSLFISFWVHLLLLSATVLSCTEIRSEFLDELCCERGQQRGLLFAFIVEG